MPIVKDKDRKPKPVLTDEQKARQEQGRAEAEQIIKEREKRAGQLMEQGLTYKQATQQYSREREQGMPEYQADQAIVRQRATARAQANEEAFILNQTESMLPAPIDTTGTAEEDQNRPTQAVDVLPASPKDIIKEAQVQKMNSAVTNYLSYVPPLALSNAVVSAFIGRTPSEGAIFWTKAVAQSVDKVRVAITGNKPLQVQKAEAPIDEGLQVLSDEIQAVKLGRDPYLALQTFNEVEEALNQLEATQKGFGKFNLNHWIDNGREIEQLVKFKRVELNAKRVELDDAIIQYRLQQARASYYAPPQ